MPVVCGLTLNLLGTQIFGLKFPSGPSKSKKVAKRETVIPKPAYYVPAAFFGTKSVVCSGRWFAP
jgi:hypothetical protein